MVAFVALRQPGFRGEKPRGVAGRFGMSVESWFRWEFQDPTMELLYHIMPFL